MRRQFLGALAPATAALLAVAIVAPMTAAAPDRYEERLTILFPDEDRGLIIFVNTTRDDYCTPAVVAWEEDVIQWSIDFDEWVDGGEVGPEPEFPPDPASGFAEGNDPIRIQEKVTGQGALVWHMNAKGLDAEIWPMVDDPFFVGPCTDSRANGGLVGTAQVQGNDNDVFVSGTRGNSWGDRGTIMARDADGEPHKYSWRFHTNDRCYVPEDGPPRCLIEQSSLK